MVFIRPKWGLIIWLFFLFGCATYYQKNAVFRENFVKGNMVEANEVLDKNKRASKDNNQLLYYLQKGTVLQMLEDYAESNNYFEKAYLFLEDYKKNIGKEVASLVTNPNTKPYTGEEFEKVLLHHYKAINYLKLKDPESALVECKRINIKLNELNDKYEKKQFRYKKDPFAQLIQGLNYESSGEINDAFIAYRNSVEAYQELIRSGFNLTIPKQLQKDVMRTAYLMGFNEELERFEKEFGFKYIHKEKVDQELVFFWYNGLGPVKDEWSINFVIVKGQGGVVMFVNEELGLAFPFPLPPMGSSSGGLGDLKFVRVAFPKYAERKPFYKEAKLEFNSIDYKLEQVQNINELAFFSLEDRMLKELSTSLLRLALKQAAEYEMRKYNQNLGALLSAANAISEKSDTRNWQVLPYSINYARVPMNEGENKIKLKVSSSSKGNNFEKQFIFNVKKGETIYHVFHNIESLPIAL